MADKTTAAAASQKKAEGRDLTIGEFKEQISELNTSVITKEPRLVSRAVRKFLTKTRKHVDSTVLTLALHEIFADNHASLANQLHQFIAHLPEPMEPMETVATEEESSATSAPPQGSASASTSTPSSETIPKKQEEPSAFPLAIVNPEVEIFLRLVIAIALLDNKLYQQAATCSQEMITRLQSQDRRTLHPLASKAFFYYSLAHEHCGQLAEIRPTLLAAHRASSLRRDDETHATILNLLLRNYLHFGLYDQADKLQAKSAIKEDTVSSNQLARYRYYQGRIKGLQLDYTGAYTYLQEAIRRAPSEGAIGFRVTVHKVAVIVQLLMGEIPERSVFRASGLKASLKPYLKLTQAVRVGDLAGFHDVVKTFGDIFRADKNYTLIQRLRHNVIKTGLRKINVSYSRIRLADVCNKLHLGNVDDAEFIVAKAIRDHVIDATLDHESSILRSKERVDVYSTTEPMEAYHARISFCLKMHNEAVRAMRYPPNAAKPSPLSDEEQKEKREAEKEILEKVQDEEDDGEF